MPKPNSDCRATERKHPWPMVRLGDVCGTINGIWKGLRKPFVHVGIIRSSNMTKNCEFSLAKTIYIDVEEKKYKQRKLLAGDIIVERSGGGPGQPVGRAVYFDLSDGEYSISNFTSILRVKDANALNGKFLQLYLTSQYFQGATENIQSNTTGLHNLDFDAYLNFKIPLPPLSIQREIVARLERELAAVEKIKKDFEALAETARAEFMAELKEVFEEISRRGAETRRLGEVCELIPGFAFKSIEFGDFSNKVIRIGNINPPSIDFSDGIGVNTQAYPQEKLSKYVAYEGDCLVAMTGATIGKMGVMGVGRAYVNQRVLIVRAKSWLDQKYLSALLMSAPFRKFTEINADSKAAQPNISAGTIGSYEIPLPTLSAQREVVARLDGAKAKAEKLAAKAQEGVAVCETMRKAILKEAFE